MTSTGPDANAINLFLSSIRGRTGQTLYQPSSSTSATTPTQPSQYTGQDWLERHPPSDDDAKYSVAPTESSVSTSMTNMWSQHSSASRATVVSTAPSRRPQHPTLHDDIVNQPPATNAYTSSLPCEFQWYASCEEQFPEWAMDEWIDHIVHEHLQSQLPTVCICWYCDDFKFDSNDDRSCGDLGLNFEYRMRHIRDHIVEENRTVQDVRPDFWLLDHLKERNLISPSIYQLACQYHEAPQTDGLYAHDWVPPHRLAQQERANRVTVSNRKERHERRRHRHRGAW